MMYIEVIVIVSVDFEKFMERIYKVNVAKYICRPTQSTVIFADLPFNCDLKTNLINWYSATVNVQIIALKCKA